MMSKVTSVLALAKYKPGDKAYWITSHPIVKGCEDIEIDPEDEWVFSTEVHPKIAYKYKLTKAWPSKAKLPKLHALDFNIVTDLLETDFVVEPFIISSVYRCPHTGEFLYCNETGDEWMCQDDLFGTDKAATAELARIIGLIQQWTKRYKLPGST